MIEKPRKPNKSKRDARRAALATHRKQALELRIAGATLPEIARALDVSVGTAWNWVNDEIDEIPKEALERHRKMHVLRSERLLRNLEPRTRTGDPQAVNSAVRALTHHAKVVGAYAPTQVTGPDGGPIDVNVAIPLAAITDAMRAAATNEENAASRDTGAAAGNKGGEGT
jgi:hypothetical protein